nr:MAG TPA: hypothetical protein [Caudoviricetes sp.]
MGCRKLNLRHIRVILYALIVRETPINSAP